VSAGTDARRRGDICHRYSRDDLSVFTDAERARFDPDGSADPSTDVSLAFELLYRLEPDLYFRLARAEPLHPMILEWMPQHVSRIVEVGPGTGRLTLSLLAHCEELVAVEPAAPMREVLQLRLSGVESSCRARIVEGFFDALPLEDSSAEMVVACSSLTKEPAHGGDRGLDEMERVCRDDGLAVIVWPNHLEWLGRHGFTYVRFEGDMAMEFADAAEAVELARVFYPDAADEIGRRGSASVPYELLGRQPPRDLAYKVVGG
jgi:SAM-dependent methyltransferase